MSKKENTPFKIIFSKNPNCSGYAMTFAILGLLFFITTLIPIIVSLFSFFAQQLSEEAKEKHKRKVKKYLKILFFVSICIYVLLFLLHVSNKHFSNNIFQDNFSYFLSFLEFLLITLYPFLAIFLSFLIASGIVNFWIFSKKETKRPVLAFIFASLVLFIITFLLIFGMLLIFEKFTFLLK